MNKTKEFLLNLIKKPILSRILLATISLSFVLITITFSLQSTYEYAYVSIWSAATLKDLDLIDSFFPILALFFVLAYIANLVSYAISFYKLYKNDYKALKILLINIYVNIIIIFLLFLLNSFIDIYGFSLWFIFILNIIINLVSLIAFKYYKNILKSENLILDHKIDQRVDHRRDHNVGQSYKYISNKFILIFDAISILILFSTLLIPIFKIRDHEYYVVNILEGNYSYLQMYIVAIIMFALYFVGLIAFIVTLVSFFSNNKNYIKKSQSLHKINLFIVTLHFIIGIIFVFWYRIFKYQSSSIGYIPLIINVIYYIIYVYILSKFNLINPKKEKSKEDTKEKISFVPLVFVIVFTLITFGSLFINIIEIKFQFEVLGVYENETKFTGLQLLTDYHNLNEIYQAIAFFYVVTLFSSVVLLIICITKYIAKAEDYNKTIKATVKTNVLFTFLFALIGVFFMFNQKYVDINIKILLEYYGIFLPTEYDYKIGTQALYIFIASILLLIGMITSHQYNTNNEAKIILQDDFKNIKEQKDLKETFQGKNNSYEEEEFDPCPAFSELDSKKREFEENFKQRQKSLFENPTLPKLVNFVMNYASNSRLHLFYKYEDIASFIAGLGTSRLAILQGLSGTGKTSLPKIFAEAIMGNCDLIEVESSWRDKNELLGYYNEFTGRYTPRKFTQSLYKAKLNPNIPTFIVLDEMNLSRIEYYFSDFLSLMEAEEHKREIKLVNVKLFTKSYDGRKSYLALKDGHTIEIPNNVWFVGTANRDDSTFEISDKVYDRAMTMNFYKRAPKVRFYEGELENQFLPNNILTNLLNEAKHKIEYDAENDVIIQDVEKLLAPYNISFGNRILKHIEEFVKIYYACFLNQNLNSDEVMKNAVETILLSKVVSKLEFKQIDNKEKLANSFDKLQLYKCSAFVRRLIED